MTQPTQEDLGFRDNNEELLQREHARDQKQSSGFDDVRFFLLRKGSTKIRVLPARSDSDGSYFWKVEEHAAFQEGFYNPVACPKQQKEPCPFCEESDRLYKEGGEDNVVASRDLRSRQQFLFNVMVYAEPNNKVTLEDGVQILKTGVKVKRQILDLDQDSAGGWGDITNINKGHDLSITRTGTTRNDTEYFVKGVPTRTDIVAHLSTAGVSLSKLSPTDLSKAYVCKSYKELKDIMDENASSKGKPAASQSSASTDNKDAVTDIPF